MRDVIESCKMLSDVRDYRRGIELNVGVTYAQRDFRVLIYLSHLRCSTQYPSFTLVAFVTQFYGCFLPHDEIESLNRFQVCSRFEHSRLVAEIVDQPLTS